MPVMRLSYPDTTRYISPLLIERGLCFMHSCRMQQMKISLLRI